jgi:3-hydroxybutyryl-CoA dehydrogenase
MEKITVIGAGTMGAGIAQVALEAGYAVCLVDVKPEYVENGQKNIKGFLSRKVAKEKITQAEYDHMLKRLAGETQVAAGVEGSAMVIEAVFEDLKIKHDIFKQLDALCSPETILCSNTSTLSITKIASVAKHPERVIGTHFFSPVPLMRLVEVIKGEKTTDDITEKTKKKCEKMGKTPIAVKDVPGFIVNRFLGLLYAEAANMIQNKIAGPKEIDAALKLGCNWPMGVIEIMDMAGIDVVYNALCALHDMTGEDRYDPPSLLKEYVDENRLGRKTGRGFYDYGSKP